jgi:hypothetical protein
MPSGLLANGLTNQKAVDQVGRSPYSTRASTIRLLSILERHLSLSGRLQSASALPTAKLLHNMLEVVAEEDDLGVVGAEGGPANR